MEDQLSSRSLLPSRKRNTFEEQIRRIKKAAELAQNKIDYATAHNEDILQAIEIVEVFLRKKHRLCYGGQAINAHLPEKYKFYDPERTVPDYDFFSPQPDQDIRVLVQDLKKAGFQEISAREGMHEGTVKLYVDYIPVADITEIDPVLYRILSKREYRVNGISYMDIHTLRMMMYLELSRPRGEVERWPKVYERLMLLNTFASKRPCRTRAPLTHILSREKVEYVIQWALENHRVFAGLDLVSVYRQQLHRHRIKKVEWLIHTRKPILFYSSTPKEDAEALREGFEQIDHHERSSKSQPSLPSYQIKTESKKGGGELLPTMTVLYQGKSPLVFLIHQTACHSYFQLPIATGSMKGETLRIASVDSLITLYFSMALLNSSYLDMVSMECLANELIQISIQMRTQPSSSPFPFISLNCSGHQSSLPSLIRAKVRRMTERKARLKQILDMDVPLSLRRKTVRRNHKRT
jgi:Poly(A) polymerase catalytic subunit